MAELLHCEVDCEVEEPLISDEVKGNWTKLVEKEGEVDCDFVVDFEVDNCAVSALFELMLLVLLGVDAEEISGPLAWVEVCAVIIEIPAEDENVEVETQRFCPGNMRQAEVREGL